MKILGELVAQEERKDQPAGLKKDDLLVFERGFPAKTGNWLGSDKPRRSPNLVSSSRKLAHDIISPLNYHGM